MSKESIDERNSLLYWYYKIQSLHIPMPRTIIIPLEDTDDILLRVPSEAEFTYGYKIYSAIDNAHLRFPLFLKTDDFSAKHDWKNTCFVPTREILFEHIARIVSKGRSGVPLRALIFREFINLNTQFTFFEGELPISVERRYFVDNGQILCRHVYWDWFVFAQAFNQDDHNIALGRPAKYSLEYRNKIKKLVEKMSIQTEEEIKLLSQWAIDASKLLEGAFSLDFAQTKEGTWILIDAALASVSEHPSH